MESRNTAPKAREACFSCHCGDKIHHLAQNVTESIYYHRGSQETLEPTHGSWGHVCAQGGGTAGRKPASQAWVVSNWQVCSVQERLWLGLRVCVARGGQPGRTGFLLDKTKDGQTQGNSSTEPP